MPFNSLPFCFTRFEWEDTPNANGAYTPIPMNWDFINDVWGKDQWFTGDLEFWAIKGLAYAGMTDEAKSLIDRYLQLKVSSNAEELLFYDRYDKDGKPLPNDKSISIVFTGLFMEVQNLLGRTTYDKAAVRTLRKYQIKSANLMIDGGFRWDATDTTAYLESKSLGEIIHAPIEDAIIDLDIDTAYQDMQEVVNSVKEELGYKLELTSSKGNTFRNGLIDTVLNATVFKLKDDVTNQLAASQFVWKKYNQDGSLDSQWTIAHQNVGKQVTVTSADMVKKARFTCEIDV